MKRAPGRDSRGTVTLFVILSLSFMLAMGGIAIDLAQFTAVQGELQRSVDAAALAGAGGLSFGSYAFDPARGNAVAYGGLNPSRAGTVTLNGTNGNITLGIHAGGAFTPSSDGVQVNAVQTRYTTSTLTSFLGILGFTSLSVSAQAIAVASPPLQPPANTCLLPIGLSRCPFEVPGVGPNTSNGCGSLVSFVVSAGTGTVRAGFPVTAAWVDLGGPGANVALRVLSAINNVANGATCPVTLSVANSPRLPAASDLGQQVSQVMEPPPSLRPGFIAAFQAQMAASPVITVTDSTGASVYTGPGWVTYVPVIDTDCPPPAWPAQITGDRAIVGWTRFIIRAIENQSDVVGGWPLPPGAVPTLGRRTIYGYYDCTIWDAPYNPNPAPISALSRRLRLVR